MYNIHYTYIIHNTYKKVQENSLKHRRNGCVFLLDFELSPESAASSSMLNSQGEREMNRKQEDGREREKWRQREGKIDRETEKGGRRGDRERKRRNKSKRERELFLLIHRKTLMSWTFDIQLNLISVSVAIITLFTLQVHHTVCSNN